MTRTEPRSSTYDGDRTRLSIVLPIFDEEENIPELYRRLVAVASTAHFGNGSVEFIFVDDGSRDGSAETILQLRAKDGRVKLAEFSRNFGHQAAFTAGLDLSRGEAVVLMDADLQDPPEVLVEMIEAWKNGADVVYAVRKNRKESVWKRLTYFSFYRILQRISNIDIPLDSGDFCLMDRKVVDQIKKLPERNRFLRGLRSWVGFNQVALPYERQARHSGKPKYTFGSLTKLALNGIFSFSSFPLRLATYLGFLVFVVGFIFLIAVIAAYFISGEYPQGWASLIVVMLFLGGVQLLILGAIGEYVAMIHDEVKERPKYVIREYFD
jgi:dolichol-phosphate mannosyltransferase